MLPAEGSPAHSIVDSVFLRGLKSLRIPYLLFRFLAFVPGLSGSASFANKIKELNFHAVANVKLSAYRNWEPGFGFPSMQDALSSG